MRVAVIFQRLGPYHHARLRAAANRIDDVIAVEIVAQDQTYPWDQMKGVNGFRKITLFSDAASIESWQMLSRRVSNALSQAEPDVVAIPGWSGRFAFAALVWSLETDTPVVLMCESSTADLPRREVWEQAKRWYVRFARSALVGGSRHRDYLVELGMPKTSIFLGYDTIDNEHFKAGAKKAWANPSAAKKVFQLPQRYFLAVSRFVPKKNLIRLIRAFKLYVDAAGATAWHLVIVGDGPMRAKLFDLRAAVRLEGQVHFPGFVQYEDLPWFYGLAETFAHVSTTEQWGLVVNEAMAAGLPVLVSDRCGCVPELVRHGENGEIVNPHDVAEIAQAMSRLSGDPDRRREMATASRTIIQDWEVSRFSDGLCEAAEESLKTRSPGGNLRDRLLLRIAGRLKR